MNFLAAPDIGVLWGEPVTMDGNGALALRVRGHGLEEIQASEAGSLVPQLFIAEPGVRAPRFGRPRWRQGRLSCVRKSRAETFLALATVRAQDARVAADRRLRARAAPGSMASRRSEVSQR